MKIHTAICALAAGVLLGGCEDNEWPAPVPEFEIAAQARSVDYLWFIPEYRDHAPLDDFRLHIVTSNQNTILTTSNWLDLYSHTPYYCHGDNIFTEGDEELERIYLHDLETDSAIYHFYLFLGIDRLEYRTEKIAGLKITSNQPIIDRAPGEPLNDLFRITASEPRCLVSYENYEILTTPPYYSEYPESIDNWLETKTYVPAMLEVQLKSGLRLPPIDYRFAVELTTTDGKRLTAETETVTFK